MDYIANTKLFEKMKVVAMGNTNKNLVEITGVVADICFQIERHRQTCTSQYSARPNKLTNATCLVATCRWYVVK